MSRIMRFDRSVKEKHKIASRVTMDDLTTTRLYRASQNRYFCRANGTTERLKFSLNEKMLSQAFHVLHSNALCHSVH